MRGGKRRRKMQINAFGREKSNSSEMNLKSGFFSQLLLVGKNIAGVIIGTASSFFLSLGVLLLFVLRRNERRMAGVGSVCSLC